MAAAITCESLSVILGRRVDEIHLTVAKSNVLGLDPETIANVMGLARTEIDDLMQTQDYKDVRLLIGAEEAKSRVERDGGWDEIESSALSKLVRRTQLENDTDTLLKIAAVANRAVRRTAPPKEHVLDPSQAGARVPLTLTRRFTEKLNGAERAELQTISGTPEQIAQLQKVTSRQISVLDGTAVNPDFQEVSNMLAGAPVMMDQTATPASPEAQLAQAEKLRVPVEDDGAGVDMSQLLAIARKLKK